MSNVNQQASKTSSNNLDILDQIRKAVTGLGSDKVVYVKGVASTAPNCEVRAGAIYVLERIAQDSIRDHISIMEILCAYARNNAPAQKAVTIEVDANSVNWQEKLNQDIANIPSPPIDIQAVLSVIGRRKNSHIEFEKNVTNNPYNRVIVLDLRKTNLQGLELEDMNFSGVLLDGAKMQGADLCGAQMQGVNLREAEMQGAILWGAQMQGANLWGAKMQRASLKQANMQKAILGEAQLQGTDLYGANLQEAFFRKAEMQGADLERAQLQKANLRMVKMQGAHISNAEMQKAILEGAQLQGAHLGKAQMQGTDLREAQMQGANLWGTQLQKSNLTGAKIDQETILIDCALTNAAVKLVDFSTIKSLTNDQVKSMFGDSSTVLPDGIEPPDWAGWECNYTDFTSKWETAKETAS